MQKAPKITKQTLRLYSPHPKQLEFHGSKARFRVAVTGRQFGKSTMCNNELIKRAWENPGQTFWFVSPTYDQARVQYRRTVGALYDCKDIFIKQNQSELRLKLLNDSQIRYVSGESLQNLRGETLHGVVIDEVRDQHPELWPLVIRPMLTTTQGWAAFVSTPSGFDSFYDLAETARNDTTGDWALIQAPSTANPLFTQSEFEAARRSMSDAQFQQEILAQFVDISAGKAYISNGSWNHRELSPFSSDGMPSRYLPIIVGMDFNVTHLRWVLGQTRNGEWYWHDEVALDSSHTAEATKALIEKVRGHEAGIVIVGDATGSARKTSAAGKTDYSIIEEMLRAANIRYENRTPEANPLVKDRVNAINAKLQSADGRVSMWYHPTKAKSLRRDLERVVWKTSAESAILDQGRDPSLTHASDAAGYPIMALDRQWTPSPGVSRMIRRG